MYFLFDQIMYTIRYGVPPEPEVLLSRCDQYTRGHFFVKTRNTCSENCKEIGIGSLISRYTGSLDQNGQGSWDGLKIVFLSLRIFSLIMPLSCLFQFHRVLLLFCYNQHHQASFCFFLFIIVSSCFFQLLLVPSCFFCLFLLHQASSWFLWLLLIPSYLFLLHLASSSFFWLLLASSDSLLFF